MTPNMGETERFVQQMVRQIVSGALHPGARLPTESALAVEYGITKTNVHLGVKELERLGLVKVVPRHAVYIADVYENMTLETLDAVFRYMDGLPARAMVEALLEMREMMACGIIHWMTRRPDRAHMDRLRECTDALGEAAGTEDDQQIFHALRELLRCFYIESGNQLFPLLVRSLSVSMRKSLTRVAQYADPMKTVAVYRAIQRHVEAGDRAAAVEVFLAWNDRLANEFLQKAYPND